jgi:hypothetical protein
MPDKPRAEFLYPVDLPQCEARRENKYLNDTVDTNFQCKWSARYTIDGHYFCSKHAGVAALQILLGAQENKRVPTD